MGRKRAKVPGGLKRARDLAERAGWEVGEIPGGHLRWKSPDKTAPLVYTHATASCSRGAQNAIADLRRAGLEI